MSLRILRFGDKGYAKAVARLKRSAQPSAAVTERVAGIVDQVRQKGDGALVELTRELDRVTLKPSQFLLKSPAPRPNAATRRVIAYALKNITAFSRERLPRDWQKKNREGATVGEQYRPFQRVGLNVPGGTAPLISTALMTVGLAKAAGVPEIVVCTPPAVNDVLHYALVQAGATEIYQIGGAQSVAAMALGTRTIRPVQKLFGPGNAYVVEAKRQMVGAVAIDQLPGPSEIAVVADETANPEFVAADLLAQAEHGHGSEMLFLTPSASLLKKVLLEIEKQRPLLSRQQHLWPVLEKGSTLVLTRNLAEALALVEDYAPEHLSLVVKNARAVAKRIRNSGAIFLGNYSPVAAGDFLAGPSHTLPTGGAAKSFSGLTVDQFFKRTSVVEYTPSAIRKVTPSIEKLAALEKLDAHGKSAGLRRH
jgi:histidinol dehydrogenase